jgi:hypothetical protein
MNKKTYQNPKNPYDTVTTNNIQTARLYLSLGWREVTATVTVKAEAKK